jgi:hypothetical protein
MIVRRVGVWSVAKLYAVMAAAGGLIAGILFALLSTLGGLAGAASSEGGSGALAGGLGALFGVGAIIFLPIMYGVLGLAAGAIGAALYNLFAGIIGGIEVELQQ